MFAARTFALDSTPFGVSRHAAKRARCRDSTQTSRSSGRPDGDQGSGRGPFSPAWPAGWARARVDGLHAPFCAALVVLAASAGCGEGDTAPRLSPVAPRIVAVNETLTVDIVASNPSNLELHWSLTGPRLPGFDRVAMLRGDRSRAEFRWTPLASHVGVHEVTFVARSDLGLARTTATITVTPAADAAPVFVRPGAGGTFDLSRDPCVRFDVEVRDDDSPSVEIRPRSALPEGASLVPEGAKRARFGWCPTPDQVEASERWTLAFVADDGDHPPVPHDFVAVLRAGVRDHCPGAAPTIAFVSPGEGATVTASGGFDVVVDAADAEGLREPPLLYYSDAAPDDLTEPDVTAFDQVLFAPDGARFRARVPLALATGESRTVYLVASVTDNDDPTGTACDHRTDTPLRTITVVGGAPGGDAAVCAPCTGSVDCGSRICAAAAGGGRCLAACAGGCAAGTCAPTPTVDGPVVSACGDVAAVCSAGGACVDDSREDDDTRATAKPLVGMLSGLTVCPDDDDWFRIDAPAGTRVDVTVSGFRHAEGDLDLQLVGATGGILATSASTMDVERASACVVGSGPIYARVFGFRGARARSYTITESRTAGACCVDDRFEPDDSRATARQVNGGAFEGTACPRNDDWHWVEVAGPSSLVATIVFDARVADLDLELYSPEGAVIAASRGTSDTETVRADVAAGRYTLRVFGYGSGSAEYLGEVMVTPRTACSLSLHCPEGWVCNGSSCVSASCTSASTCPSGHLCPVPGPVTTARVCAPTCATNADCRSTEACKWLPEGRACGRRGAGANGATCGTYADCGGQRACVAWPGGYCARVGCERNADCESGTFCVTVGAQRVCALSCWASEDVCRRAEGYRCDVVEDRGGALQLACVPR
jgi:hypothetical protein